MQAQAYYLLAEEALERPDALERLSTSAERDPDLTDTERASVCTRIDSYLADHDAMEHDPDTGDGGPDGDELEAA
jgi:hypothetical protein